ncbi:plasmid partitioning/stability family protein [Kosakonia sacchari]|uniref:plasmid partitioning/stability family protein n=1 Tax=Kosakonia sacchari TaxID=1158459 RepID=UPI002ACDC310|nr:plasmid partitioning/stability family protein [Kosakonia sacchari]MDZ7324917.1 plasmid partitioning/stability family protein [Kosakonia sacchari]
MDKPDTRRKIMFYLNPESSDADRYVCDEIDRMPQGERGKVWRAALVSGFALRKQDTRLPNMLAELLNEHTTFEEMVTVMQAVFPEEMKRFENRGRAVHDLQKQRTEDALMGVPGDETRSNAQAMFGLHTQKKDN